LKDFWTILLNLIAINNKSHIIIRPVSVFFSIYDHFSEFLVYYRVCHKKFNVLISVRTTIFVIFYIALTKTIYTRIPLPCFTAAPCSKRTSALMFFVCFFLIFMFCAKTNVGYFNYLRFIYLVLQPSYRTLVILLIISFFISIIWTSFTSRFTSNTSFNITQLHESKLCWFTREVIYYFMRISVCILFLSCA